MLSFIVLLVFQSDAVGPFLRGSSAGGGGEALFGQDGGIGAEFGGFGADRVVHDGCFRPHEPGGREDAELGVQRQLQMVRGDK